MFDKMVENFLRKDSEENILSLDGLYRAISEALETDIFKTVDSKLLKERRLFVEDKQNYTFTLQAIPEISVTELGWTNIVGSEGGEQIAGPERQRLMQFLQNIKGGDFVAKIQSLSQFYEDPDAAMAQMFQDNPNASTAERIAVALSYLVFFKTLTKVISNFNAASAGFNFESFLAVLVNGEQVKANTGTIADFISRADGTNMPVSLKLYQEKKLHVGGSFTDLVGDLVNPQFDHALMRYLAVTKEFEGGKKEGLDINGVLRWYRFDFTLDNVFDILARSSLKSKKCVMLPVDYISGRVEDFEATLPGSAIPSPEKMEQVFINAFRAELEAMNDRHRNRPDMQIDEEGMDVITKNLNWSKNDDIFLLYDPNPALKKGEERDEDFDLQPLYVSRGNSKMPGSGAKLKKIAEIVLTSLSQLKADDGSPRYDMDAPEINKIVTGSNAGLAMRIAYAIVRANNGTTVAGQPPAAGKSSVMSMYSRSVLKDERTQKLNQPGVFASVEDSVSFYNQLDEDGKKRALVQSYGYLTTEQFNLNQSAVAQVHAFSDKRILPKGQSEALFGRILVGADNTQNMLNKMTSILNESIFDIFMNVKNVQDNTYAYIAGGMKEDSKADEAITASSSIISKTMELKTSKSK